MPNAPSVVAHTARVLSLAILLCAVDGAHAAAPHRERHGAERPPPGATPDPRGSQNDVRPLSGARRIGLSDGWRFFKGDVEGAERPDFADGTWRLLDVPHDWDATSLGRKRRGTERVPLPVGDSVNDSGTFATPCRLRWDVPYQPGTLRVVAYRGGRVVAETAVHTAGPPARIRLVAERARLTADGRDLTFIAARIEDAEGRLCPLAGHTLRFAVKGPGSLAGVGNGDPQTTAPFQADQRDAFNGLALVIVRSVGRPGPIAVTAAGAGRASGSVTVEAVANETAW